MSIFSALAKLTRVIAETAFLHAHFDKLLPVMCYESNNRIYFCFFSKCVGDVMLFTNFFHNCTAPILFHMESVKLCILYGKFMNTTCQSVARTSVRTLVRHYPITLAN